MKASTFVDGIDLDNINKKYNLTKVFIELDKSNVFDLSDFIKPPKDIATALVCQTKIEDTNRLDKLCQQYFESKST